MQTLLTSEQTILLINQPLAQLGFKYFLIKLRFQLALAKILDTWDIIRQDSHLVFVNEPLSVMVGNVKGVKGAASQSLTVCICLDLLKLAYQCGKNNSYSLHID